MTQIGTFDQGTGRFNIPKGADLMANSSTKVGIKGLWRVYFNDKRDYPLVWSIDDGDPEHEGKFSRVTIHGLAESAYDPSKHPHAYLVLTGEMIVDGTTATIWGEMHVRQRQ